MKDFIAFILVMTIAMSFPVMLFAYVVGEWMLIGSIVATMACYMTKIFK